MQALRLPMSSQLEVLLYPHRTLSQDAYERHLSSHSSLTLQFTPTGHWCPVLAAAPTIFRTEPTTTAETPR